MGLRKTFEAGILAAGMMLVGEKAASAAKPQKTENVPAQSINHDGTDKKVVPPEIAAALEKVRLAGVNMNEALGLKRRVEGGKSKLQDGDFDTDAPQVAAADIDDAPTK